MPQEPSFLGTNIMLVLGKLYVSTVGTTLHIGTPKAHPASSEGTSMVAQRHILPHPLRTDDSSAPCRRGRMCLRMRSLRLNNLWSLQCWGTAATTIQDDVHHTHSISNRHLMTGTWYLSHTF